MNKLRTLCRRSIGAWAVCSAVWLAADLRATFQVFSPGGGLGAVSAGLGEPDAIGIVLLLAANVTFWWRLRRAESLARNLSLAYLLTGACYLLLGVAGVLILTGTLTDYGETTALWVLAAWIVWNTFLPTQAFFMASALTIAAQRSSEAVAPTLAGGMRWRLIASAILVVEAAAAVYLALVGWLLAVWMVDDFVASRMVAVDWYLEAASRAAVAILTGAIFAGVAYLVNLRTVSRGFSVGVATTAALVGGAVIAVAGLAGAVWFAITKPWF